MTGALITGWDWAAVAAFVVAAVAAVVWEVRGVFRHEAHQVDTISELYWQLRQRVGRFRAVLATVVGGVFLWLWWHFTFEGQINRSVIRNMHERRAQIRQEEEGGG